MDAAIAAALTELAKYGLPGLGLIGISYLYMLERKDRKEAQDGRLADQKLLQELLSHTRVAMEATENALNRLTDELRRRP